MAQAPDSATLTLPSIGSQSNAGRTQRRRTSPPSSALPAAHGDQPPSESTLFLAHAKNLVQDAADAAGGAAAGGGGSLGMPVLTSDVQRLCVDLLTRGDVRSFQDFFLLTHSVASETSSDAAAATSDKVRAAQGDQADSPQATPAARSQDDDSLQVQTTSMFRPREKPESIEVLHFLKEHLSEAETAQRLGDPKSIVGAYTMLAEHFERRGAAADAVINARVAVHFYSKCLLVAEKIGDPSLEGGVHRSLGACYQRLGDTELAIQHYERFEQLAKEDKANREVASKHLVSAYQTFAEYCAGEGDWQRAVSYYLKVAEKAKEIGDTSSQGEAHYKLGTCYKQLGDAESSIKHLCANLEICRAAGDEVGEAAACSALASAHQGANDREKSIQYLLDNYSLATRTGQLEAQGKACCNLGILYNTSADYERAAQYFEQYYAIARQVGDPRLLDSARVYLGVARGNMRLRQFSSDAASSQSPIDAVRSLFSSASSSAVGSAQPFLSSLVLPSVSSRSLLGSSVASHVGGVSSLSAVGGQQKPTAVSSVPTSMSMIRQPDAPASTTVVAL